MASKFLRLPVPQAWQASTDLTRQASPMNGALRSASVAMTSGVHSRSQRRVSRKELQAVNKKSLDLLQSYAWPGNIRELQNIIERSAIVCETENFSVDESWLSRHPLASESKSQLELARKLASADRI